MRGEPGRPQIQTAASDALAPSLTGKAPGISVIIVSYNVRQYLDACLQSVRHAAEGFRGAVEVIVFDNDSRDGTVPLLKPRYPDVVWLTSDRNLGFGSGCNRGAAVSTQPLLLFLNPDTLLGRETFQVMWDFFRAMGDKGDIGVAGCRIVGRDGSLQLACKRSFPSPAVAAFKLAGLSALFPKSRLFGQYNLTYLDENKTHEVDAVSGSFLCIERRLFKAVRGFDEDFFMYGEDLDICFRVKLLGKKNYYHPATSVRHFKGESAKTRPIRTFFNFYEAMVIFSRKHLELRTLPLAFFYLGVFLLACANFASSRLQKWQRWATDLLLVNLSLAAATPMYMGYLNMPSLLSTNRRLYFFWHALMSGCVLASLAYAGEYGRKVQPPRKVFLALSTAFLAFFALSFFMKEEAYSRLVFGFAAAFSVVALMAWRLLVRHGGKLVARIMGSTRRVAVLGANERARRLAELIRADAVDGYEFVGFIQPPGFAVPAEFLPNTIGGVDALPGLVKKMDLHEVIIALEDGAYQAALRVLSRQAEGNLEVKMLVGEPKAGSISLIDLNFRA